MVETGSRDIHLAGTKIEHPHICAFFHSQSEEYRLMLPFIKEGIERGEKAFHIVDPKLEQDHRQRLQAGGLETDQLESSRQLEIHTWEQSHLGSQGSFDMHYMLEFVQELLTASKQEGFPGARVVGHMEWSLQDRPGVNDLIEYESRLNYVLPAFHDPVICIYDLARHSAGTIMDILRVHPMVIMGNQLQINPFYVEPDEFLKELEVRRTG